MAINSTETEEVIILVYTTFFALSELVSVDNVLDLVALATKLRWRKLS